MNILKVVSTFLMMTYFNSAFAALPKIEVNYFSCNGSGHTASVYAEPSRNPKREAILVIDQIAYLGSTNDNLTNFTSNDGVVTAVTTSDATPPTFHPTSISLTVSGNNLNLNNCKNTGFPSN